MTYLEKARELEPYTNEGQFVMMQCPYMLGIERESRCQLDGNCTECWNREIPAEVEK